MLALMCLTRTLAHQRMSIIQICQMIFAKTLAIIGKVGYNNNCITNY